MAITATSSGNSQNFEVLEAGSYPARCYSMVHIGTVEENIMGALKRLNKVRVTWELPTELVVFNEEKGEQPRVISKEFTLSLHEKATLRAFLKNWRGKDFTEEEAKEFDVTKLISAPCMLNITHKKSKDRKKTYLEIGSVSRLPKGMECPTQISESFIFDYDENFDLQKLEGLPDFIKDKVKKSDEFMAKTSLEMPNHSGSSNEEDEAPF